MALRFDRIEITGSGNNHQYPSITNSSGQLIRLQTGNGYIDIGPNNTTYAHIQTDRGKFYFNKKLIIDEGMISSYNEDFSFAVNNGANTAITIDKDSPYKVGIGTTNPDYKLHIDAASGGFLKITESGTDRLTLDSNNELVLTAPSNWGGYFKVGKNVGNYEAAIEIGEGRTANNYSRIDLIGDTTYTDYGFRIIRGNGGANTTSQLVHRGTGNFELVSSDSGDIILNPNSGNVGIGTTSPRTKLHVTGLTGDDDPALRSSTAPFFVSNTANSYGLNIGVNNLGDAWLQAQSNTSAIAYDILLNPSGGNVGIGTTSPNAKLDIDGNFRANTNNLTLSNTPSWGVPTQNIIGAEDNTNGATLTLMNTSATIPAGGVSGTLQFVVLDDARNNGGAGYATASISASSTLAPGTGQSGQGNLIFKTGGYYSNITEKMRITHGGNVGIGATSPGAKLEVNGTSLLRGLVNITTSSEMLRLNDTNSAGSPYMTFYQNGTRRSFIQHNDSSNTFIIASEYGPIDLKTATNGSESTRMRISGTGDVGIGDTSPDAKLTVYRTASTYAVNLSDTESRAGLSVKSSSSFDSKLTISSGASSRQYIQAVNNAATTGRDIVLNPYGGNVGIGATSPETRFHVFQNANVGGSAGNFEKLRTLQNSGGSGGNNVYVREWGYRTSSGTTWTTWSYHNGISVDSSYGTPLWNTKTFWHREPNADKQYFGGGSNKVLTIQGGGGTNRVGINDDTPSYALDVSGTIRATGDVIAYSDIRVKENITTIENALDKVKKLRGVEYNKIDNPEKSIGVIAQEIEEVIPEVVKEDNEGMKSVAYGNITAVLIEAIKEQQKQIDELKNQLNAFTK